MRSRPGGTLLHKRATSAWQIARMTMRRCGMMKGRTCNGATAGAAGAAAGGAGTGWPAAGAGCAAGADAGGGPTALTAALHPPDNRATFRFRHSSASLPPGCTPSQIRHEIGATGLLDRCDLLRRRLLRLHRLHCEQQTKCRKRSEDRSVPSLHELPRCAENAFCQSVARNAKRFAGRPGSGHEN